MRLKNLSPKYLDNRMIDEFETEFRAANHENIGNPMVFETYELLREKISDINEKVVNEFNGIMEKVAEQAKVDAAPKITNTQFLDYTPVNKETFGIWCSKFLEELKEEEDL